MPRSILKPVPTASEQLEALLGYPWPFPGRPPKHDLSTWTVADDWPERVPVTEVEVADREVRIIGSKSNLLQTLTAAAGVRPATPSVRSSVPKWRRGCPTN